MSRRGSAKSELPVKLFSLSRLSEYCLFPFGCARRSRVPHRKRFLVRESSLFRFLFDTELILNSWNHKSGRSERSRRMAVAEAREYRGHVKWDKKRKWFDSERGKGICREVRGAWQKSRIKKSWKVIRHSWYRGVSESRARARETESEARDTYRGEDKVSERRHEYE